MREAVYFIENGNGERLIRHARLSSSIAIRAVSGKSGLLVILLQENSATAWPRVRWLIRTVESADAMMLVSRCLVIHGWSGNVRDGIVRHDAISDQRQHEYVVSSGHVLFECRSEPTVWGTSNRSMGRRLF